MPAGTIIIGAGHAGVQAAASLRQEGYSNRILLINRETDFPYHKPPLSKGFLKQPEGRAQPLRAESFYQTHGIDLALGCEVEQIDTTGRKVILRDGRSEIYDKLILATGALPRRLPVSGAKLDQVVELRTMADARRLREVMPGANRVVIIGGGFIGLELAATMEALGKTVTVIEHASRVLGRAVSNEVSQHVRQSLEAAGVTILLDRRISSNVGSLGRMTAITLSDGTEIAADLVVSAIGVVPECTLAESAGIACDNGVLVDAAMRTGSPDILAIGDCARFPYQSSCQRVRLESVQAATDQARLAARTILGYQETYTALPWFWSDIGQVKLQMVGLTLGADREVVGRSCREGAFSVYHFAGPQLIAIDSVNRPADHLLGRKMLTAGFSPTEQDIQTNTVAEAFATWQTQAEATDEAKLARTSD